MASRELPFECDVAVVGGGLGGLALMVGLRKLGLDAHCFEAAKELRTATGTLIGLGGNGFYALEQLDPQIVQQVKQHGKEAVKVIREERSKGSNEPNITEVPLPTPLTGIRWAAVQDILATLVPDDRVHTSHNCTGYTEHENDEGSDGKQGGGVTVHFANQPDVRVRLCVGADGVRSAVRGTMHPDDPGPRYLGHMNWNCVRYIPGSSSFDGPAPIKTIMDTSGGVYPFNTYLMLVNAGDDYRFWQVRMQYDEPAFTGGDAGGGGVPSSKARLLEKMRELGWEEGIQEVEATDESAIFERAIWDRLPLTKWSSPGGHVVLLGDAAHAMHPGPGLGARTAFEDAHQLMEALKTHWPDVPAAVHEYEGKRIARTTAIQNIAAEGCGLENLKAALTADLPDDLEYGKALSPARQARSLELYKWINSYPDNATGVPDAKYFNPEAVAEHNAAAAKAVADMHLRQHAAAIVDI